MPRSFNILCTVLFFEISKFAQRVHTVAPVLMEDEVALAPSSKSIDWIIMDLPAPVSPVITVNPF